MRRALRQIARKDQERAQDETDQEHACHESELAQHDRRGFTEVILRIRRHQARHRRNHRLLPQGRAHAANHRKLAECAVLPRDTRTEKQQTLVQHRDQKRRPRRRVRKNEVPIATRASQHLHAYASHGHQQRKRVEAHEQSGRRPLVRVRAAALRVRTRQLRCHEVDTEHERANDVQVEQRTAAHDPVGRRSHTVGTPGASSSYLHPWRRESTPAMLHGLGRNV